MNYLHDRYRKSGKILDSDMLYTLSLFALEPPRWVERYEWRSLTEVELCACGTFWKAMGDAMMISFMELPSSKVGWTDGLHWLEEIKEWSLKYEEVNMVPALTNRQLANSHLDVLFMNMPSSISIIGKKTVGVLLGGRLRRAMMWVYLCLANLSKLKPNQYKFRLPEPSPSHEKLVNRILFTRKLLLRFFALPRPEFLRMKYIPSAPDKKTGRFNSVKYLSYPWYVKPSLRNRWGPMAWMLRAIGRKIPGDDGNMYAPEGYKFSEIGPQAFKGKGCEEMNETRARLNQQNRGGCPFLPI